MKNIFNFFSNIFKKIFNFFQYFKYKLKIISLTIDIFIIKVEYLILVNKYIYEILYFYKYNEIISIIKFFIIYISDELKKDYKILKKNMKIWKYFHRDMNIFFVPFYLFFFLAGILPFIYLLLLSYFIIKYSIKYLLLTIDIYIYNYYEYRFDEDENIFILIYINIRKYIRKIFFYINYFYIKIDKFLFRMERIKKFKIKLLDLQELIWDKFVDIVQKYIDKFDNFILIRFPELWYDFEMFLYNLIIKLYILKARSIKKIKKIKKYKRKKKKYLYKYFYKYKKFKIKKFNFYKFKIKYILIDYINYKKFYIRKFFVINFKIPYLNILCKLEINYIKIKIFLRHYKNKLKWHLIMIIHPWFWDYIFYLYIYIFYWDSRAYILYIFPTSPFFHIWYSIDSYDIIPHMWRIGIPMKIKAILYRILRYFIFKPPIFLYKIIVYIMFLLYKNIYINLKFIIKFIIWLIIYYLYNNEWSNNLIYNIKDFFYERWFRFFTLKRNALIDFLAWTAHIYYHYWKSWDMELFDNYNKYYLYYKILNHRYTYYIFFILSKYQCFKNCFYHYHGWDDIIDLFDIDVYFHEYYVSLFIYNKYIYRYPVENMRIYNYSYFIVKPGNFLMLRHYADKDLPFSGTKLFVNFKCADTGDYYSCYVCPLFSKTTTLHLLSGSGTKFYDTYTTEFIVLPERYLVNPKSQFKHRIIGEK